VREGREGKGNARERKGNGKRERGRGLATQKKKILAPPLHITTRLLEFMSVIIRRANIHIHIRLITAVKPQM